MFALLKNYYTRVKHARIDYITYIFLKNNYITYVN